jgi:2-hydroxy-6-oxonona-2,4-dienedioate hydrolase
MNEDRYRAAEARLWRSLGAQPTERRLRLRRTATEVRIQEVGQGPPVVFVHGANTNGASWAALAATLDGFRCILLDRPGTGLSPPTRAAIDATTLPAFGEALVVDVLDALDLPSAHLVATSFGGYVALRTAAAHPDRIDRMVLFSWSAGLPAERLPAFMRLMTFPGAGRLAAVIPQSEGSVRRVFRALGDGPALDDGRITPEDIACYLALVRDTDTMRNELAMGRALIRPIGGLDRIRLPDQVLESIRTPTCLLWGEKDPFGGAEIARRLAARLPNVALELISGAGHAPWLDDVDHCAAATRAFLTVSSEPRPVPRTPAGGTDDPWPSSAP